MVSDNDIAYAESLVRRLREALATKQQQGAAPEEIKKFQDELKLKERDVLDLRNRKRKAEDQEQREKKQKEMDERRKRFA